MSLPSDESKVQRRLSEINDQAVRLQASLQVSLEGILALKEQLLGAVQGIREVTQELVDLRAEARYLCLTHGLEMGNFPEPADYPAVVDELCHSLSANLKPVAPSDDWVEKIRLATISQKGPAILSQEESAELRQRLEEIVCPLCVNYALDGSCTLEAFDECPIATYQDRIVDMIEKFGHSPWMEDYFQRMYQSICPLCRERLSGDVCVPREEGDCALFTYLPAVVKTVEEFLQERAASRSAQHAKEK